MKQDPDRPSFFKIMFNGFTETIRFPPAFMENFKGGLPHIFKLKCAYSRSSWWVATEESKEGCFFRSGWSKFAKDLNLELTDFVVFELVENSTFEVKIYGRTACVKNTVVAANRHDDGVQPSFFKIMFNGFTEAMRIPPPFMENFKGGVPHIFELKCAHSRNSWWVATEEKKKGCFFGIGWSKFAKDLNLELTDFVVFELVENSIFKVKIYGRTACVKNTIIDANRHDNGVQSPVLKRAREEKHIEEHTAKRKKPEGAGATVKMARKFPRKVEMDAEPKEFYSHQLVLKHYNRCHVIIPRKMARETGLEWKKKTLIKNPEGKTWDVHISVWKSGQTCLSKGWSDFWKANRLDVGTTILLQFSGGSGNEIDVQIINRGDGNNGTGKTISRPTKRAGKFPGKMEMDKKPKGVGRILAGTTDRRPRKFPQKVKMDAEPKEFYSHRLELKYYNRSYVIIPRKIARETGLVRKMKTVIKDPEGKTWDAHVSVWKSGQTCLNTGWSKFWVANGLDVGTTILLQFSGRSGNEIDVQIINRGDGNYGARKSISRPIKRARKFPRKMEMDAEHISECKKPKGTGGMACTTDKRARRFPKRVEMGAEPKGFYSYQLELKHYNRSYVIIPRKIARETGLVRKTKTVIKDSEGKSWDVHVSVWKSGQPCITGWSNFWAANGLNVGTTILLQFSGGLANEIEVHILNRGAGKCISRPNRRARKFPKKMEMDAETNDSSVQLVLKEYSRYGLYLPKRFAEETGLQWETETVIKDPEGKTWDISTTASRKMNQTFLSAGWSYFWAANGLRAGTTILLQFNRDSGNEIEVQILNRGDEDSGAGESFSTPIIL